jgi:hypothetical protein
MRIKEIATLSAKGPLSPEQQRIKTMQAQVKRAQQAIKAERARQRIKAGQKTLSALKETSAGEFYKFRRS